MMLTTRKNWTCTFLLWVVCEIRTFEFLMRVYVSASIVEEESDLISYEDNMLGNCFLMLQIFHIAVKKKLIYSYKDLTFSDSSCLSLFFF